MFYFTEGQTHNNVATVLRVNEMLYLHLLVDCGSTQGTSTLVTSPHVCVCVLEDAEECMENMSSYLLCVKAASWERNFTHLTHQTQEDVVFLQK